LVVASVILLVYIPEISQLVGAAFLVDHFHHLDFYAMSPALAFRHGVPLGTDFYSQYGVGWPVVLASFSKVAPPLSYELLLRIGMAWACVYYSVLYLFLRLLLKNNGWAAFGLLLTLSFQLFGGTDGFPKWILPSSTVMRYSMDVFVFLVCYLHATSGKAWLGLPAGIFAALAVLFSTDTGIYVSVCLAGYLLAASRLQSQENLSRHVGRFIGWTSLGFFGILLYGLAIASRGTLCEPEFWLGWTESLRVYRDGFGHIPIKTTIESDPSAFLLLMLILVCYLFAAGRMIQEFFDRRLTPTHLIVGLIAVYGSATFLLFIGRSHPFNIHHPSVPFCIVITSYVAEIFDVVRRATQSLKSYPLFHKVWRVLPFACAFGVLFGLYVQPASSNYHNVLWWLTHDHLDTQRIPDANFLFPGCRDGLLPNQYLGEAARFKEIVATLQELSDGGRNTVGIIDQDDTGYLVAADLRPQFRYSPVIANLVSHDQEDLLLWQLSAYPPDYLLFPAEPPRTIINGGTEDVHQSIATLIHSRYALERKLNGLKIYRLKSPPSASPP
jgi:hypothetical protein